MSLHLQCFWCALSWLEEEILTGDSTLEGELKALCTCFSKLETCFYSGYQLTKDCSDWPAFRGFSLTLHTAWHLGCVCRAWLCPVSPCMVPPWDGVCDPGSLTVSSRCLQECHLFVPRCAGAVGVLLSHSQLSCSLLKAAGLCWGLVLAEHSFGLWQLLGWWTRKKFGTLVNRYQQSTSFDYSHCYYCLFHIKLLKFPLLNIACPIPGSLPVNLRDLGNHFHQTLPYPCG